MALRLFLAVVALAALMWFFGWYGKAGPAQRVRALKLAMLYGIAGVLLLLVATGRIHWLFALFGALLPWLQRFLLARQAWHTYKASRGPHQGQRSAVETGYLRAVLDHDSGAITGQVLAGTFRGRALESLSREELIGLLQEVRAEDHDSIAILEAFLDRIHEGWRAFDNTGSSGGQGAPASGMTRDQALEILGLGLDATRAEIIEAHRRLMQKLHPDRGGNDFLAAQINRAKDVLLDG